MEPEIRENLKKHSNTILCTKLQGFPGADINELITLNKQLGGEEVNLSCSSCITTMMNFLYNQLVELEPKLCLEYKQKNGF